MKTVVLLSGGLDSATVLAGCVAQGDECFALGFAYGQPHKIELEYARKLADHYEVPFKILMVLGIPLVDDVVFSGRNLVLSAHAIAFAQARKFDRIAVGCNESDWARFPDCRPAFWKALRDCADAYGIEVVTPLLHSWKGAVVEAARKLNVPINQTWSCYSPEHVTYPVDHITPCGRCLACTTRE